MIIEHADLQRGVLCHSDQHHPLGEYVGPDSDLSLGKSWPGANGEDALVDTRLRRNEQHLLLLCGLGANNRLVLHDEALVRQTVHLQEWTFTIGKNYLMSVSLHVKQNKVETGSSWIDLIGAIRPVCNCNGTANVLKQLFTT